MLIGTLRASVRLAGLVVASGLVWMGAVSAPAMSAVINTTRPALCAALSPPRVPLPAALRRLGMHNFSLTLSSDASEHQARCSVGLSSPSNEYADNVGWDVFPSHALAVADFTSYPVRDLYNAISVDRRATGFPSPNFEIVGKGKLTGRAVSVVAFVDGTAIVSAYIYASSNSLSAVLPIARWAVREINALKSVTPARR